MAIDAAGASVKAVLGVSAESTLTVSVEPAKDATYPILVDPLFQSYEWKTKNSTTGINFNPEEEEWRQDERNKMPMNVPGPLEWYLHNKVPTANYPIQADWRGLYVHGHGELRAGDHFAYMYAVPRYYSDQKAYGTKPDSYISRMDLSNVVWLANSNGMSPYVTMGLYDPNNGYVSYYKHEGLKGHSVTDMGFTYPFENKSANTSVKTASVGFDSYEPVFGINALFVGTASIQLTEPTGNLPGLTTKNTAPWVYNTPTPVEFTASDSGLGVYSVTATAEKTSEVFWKASYGCTGVPGSACPRTWKSTDVGHSGPIYKPASLPEGESFLKVVAEDPLGQKSVVAYTPVKVDRTKPSLALSGTITEQGNLGVSRPIYELAINATDGIVAAPQSGVVKTTIEIDGKVVNESAPGCSTQNCSVSRNWTLDAGQYSSGTHLLKVVATDAVGITTTKTQSFKLQPTAPPQVELAGSATQQATLGTSRPRYVLKTNASTESGFNGTPVTPATFITSFGGTGTGKGQFNVANGNAVDSKGSLWVVDWEGGRVEQFNAKGEYVSQFGEPGSNPGQLNLPLGLAIDAAGNFWVTSGDGRIQEFSPAGKFIKQFGKSGSTDGAFKNPLDIAIDSKGNLWILENTRVQVLDQEGKFLFKFGTQGKENGQLSSASGIAIAPDGSVWVADTNNNRLQKFDAAGKFLAAYGEEGIGNGNLSGPDGIDIDQAGNVYVADGVNRRVQVFNAAGQYLTQFGSIGTGPGQFVFPSYLSIDPSGNIWIDSGSNKIQRWRSPVAPPTFSFSFGSKGSGAGQFTTPSSVATDSAGNLWVVDRANARIEKFNADGQFLSQFGAKGSGAGELSSPYGIAIDPNANVWVTDTTNTRVVEFNSKGEFLATFGTNVNKTKVEAGGTQAEKNLCTAASKNVCQAGTAGSLEGQMRQPTGITTSPGGNLFVVEKFNGRVEKFSPAGEVLASFGTLGSGEGKLLSPSAVAMSPDGNYIWVADSGANRIQKWTSAYSFVKSVGTVGASDGQFEEPYGISIDSKGNVWVADTYRNRIQGFNSDGDFLTKFGNTGNAEAQLGAPYSLTTDASGNIWVADTGNNRIQKWIPPTSKASTITSEITIDGKVVNTKVGRCGTEACAVASEFALENATYLGKHTVQVKATDGLGRSTTKTLALELQKDATKPTLETSGGLAAAPEGWVEQETYNLNATATDAGYGLTSLIATIDGKQVASWTNSCVDGGCDATIAKAIDMSAYSGGSHPAEVVATDGAGNVTKKTWTVNVDPEGHISVEEAADTLEALEGTTEANPIGTAKEEDQYYGTAAGLGLAQTENDIVVTGSKVPTVIATDPAEGVEMSILPDNSFVGPCETESSSPEEEEELGENKPESEAIEPSATSCSENEEGNFVLEDIEISPMGTAQTATDNDVLGGQAAVATNIVSNVDAITRPLYEGVLTFQDIRDATAPESFTWEVELAGGQEMKLLDPQHAAVYYAGGHPAFGIQAQAAHDAIGTTVATKLEVTGKNLLTLRVDHHGKAFVYPVLSGVGWQGGFVSVEVEGPLDEQQLKEEEERIKEEEQLAWEAGPEGEEEAGEVTAILRTDKYDRVSMMAQGPPVSVEKATFADLNVSKYTHAKKFNFRECYYDSPPKTLPEPQRIAYISDEITECKMHYGWRRLQAKLSVHGWFRTNSVIREVWIMPFNLHCDKWGHSVPAMADCERRPASAHPPGRVNLYGDYRFWPGDGPAYEQPSGGAGVSACVTVRGSIEYGTGVHSEEPVLSPARQGTPCEWP